MAKHIAVYIRVSSKHQDQWSQEADLKRWVESGQPVVLANAMVQSARCVSDCLNVQRLASAGSTGSAL